MELSTAQWSGGAGWNQLLPDWDGPSTFVLVHGPSDLPADDPALREVVAAYPNSCVLGCSTAGEIFGDTLSDQTLTVAVARFAATRLNLVCEPVGADEDGHDAGVRMGKRLLAADPDLRAAFVLSDGTGVNGSALVAGLLSAAGEDVSVSGGLAGDDDRFARTWVLVDGVPRSGWVSAVGLSGPRLLVGHGSHGGWDIFGPERRVTSSRDNVLLEIDGKPALALYKEYLGERAAGLPATALLFPLSLRVPGAEDRQVVRTVLAVDEVTQSLTFAGDVPQGSYAQLMRANVDRIVEGGRVAAAAAAVTGSAGDVLAVAVSCIGRRLLLGRRTEDELEEVVSALPAGAGLVGFYSYGEISPVLGGGCDLHNQTMTVTVLAESA